MPENLQPKPIIGNLNIYALLALAGIIGPLVLIATDIAATMNAPGYNLVHNSISSLVWSPLGWVQTAGFMAIGLLVEIFVIGLFFCIRGKRGFGLGVALLVCFGFGLLLVGAFRVDPAGASQTIEGTIHSATAKVVFIIFPVAIMLIAFSLRQDSRWKGLFVHTITASGLALVMVLVWLWLSEDMVWFGLYERILVANTIIWVEVMAVRLLLISIRSPGELKTPAMVYNSQV